MLLFTALTGNWQTDRLLVNMLTKYLRRDKLTFKMAWAIEPNPSGDGYHAHAWTHGDWLPKRTLQNRAEQVGLGWCDVRPVTYHGNFSYVVKDATWNDDSLSAHRRLNGPEPIHARGFWRNPDGNPLTQRQAITLVRPGSLQSTTSRSLTGPTPPKPRDWTVVPTHTIGNR